MFDLLKYAYNVLKHYMKGGHSSELGSCGGIYSDTKHTIMSSQQTGIEKQIKNISWNNGWTHKTLKK